MFTGIIQAMGRLVHAQPAAGGMRIVAACERLADFGLRTGDSVAVNGVCLTVLEPGPERFSADLSAETLARTTLGRLRPGAMLNLEPALKAGDPLGGHLVTGHVDGLATLLACEPLGDNRCLAFEAPDRLARYIAAKGSVAIDGVSLTVNRVAGPRFDVNLIPHTLAVTTLGSLTPGDEVNLEIDPLARYLERLLEYKERP
ncbi:MAG: riboflavin synthase [Wenzhouxiangellaceae bacterium]